MLSQERDTSRIEYHVKQPEPVVDTELHLRIAESYLHVREIGNNSSPEIDQWLKYVGLNPGNPYCAAFVSFCIAEAGAREPPVKSGLARHFIRSNSIPASKVLIGIEQIPPGSIVVWRRGNTIFGHVGIVKQWDKAKGITIEANTSSGERGSQSDGDGVYIRSRTIIPGAVFRITDFTIVKY